MPSVEPGELHCRDGVVFKTEPDGAVTIAVPVTVDSPVARVVTIPAQEWASIVFHCARGKVDPHDASASANAKPERRASHARTALTAIAIPASLARPVRHRLHARRSNSSLEQQRT